MEKYSVFKLDKLSYDFLIVANTFENPVNMYLSEEEKFKFEFGKVVFDLTLIYGCKLNQYVVAEVNNYKLDISSIKPIADLEESIKIISQEHFL